MTNANYANRISTAGIAAMVMAQRMFPYYIESPIFGTPQRPTKTPEQPALTDHDHERIKKAAEKRSRKIEARLAFLHR